MTRLVLAVYRGALLLLPPAFRREWGGAMADEARSSLEEARQGGGRSGGVARAVARLAVDLVGTFGREWWAALTGESPLRRGDGGGALSDAARDVAFAVRSFGRAPLFTALVVATLGLGIGANTAIFTVVNAVVLRPLPYPEPDRLVSLWPGKLFSRALLEATREGMPSAEGVSLYGGSIMTITEGGEPAELFGAEVTTNHFSVVGVRPVLGRDFVADDGEPGAAPVVILSHELWTRRFGSDPGVIGRSVALQVEDEPRRMVVGVMGPAYRDLLNGAEAWVPVVIDRAADEYGNSSFALAAARLRPGATLETARSEMLAVARRLREEDPGLYSAAEVERATAVPMARELASTLRSHLLALLGAVGVVLLIACVNVANLLLVRASARGREVGIRTAMGAGRGRLLRQFLTESVLLGLAGGVAGVAVAWVTRDLLVASLPSGFRLDEAAVDLPVLLFTLAVAVGASLLFGVVPALRASRHDPARSLVGGRGVETGRGALRLQRGLVAGEVALALLAVFSATLLVTSVRDVLATDPGFEPEGVLTFRLTAPPESHPTDDDVLRFFEEVRAAVADVPGVESAGVVSRLPMGGGTSRTTAYPEGFEPDASGELPEVTHRLVTDGYAETLGLRLVEGRFPTADEYRDGPQMTYVNRTAAERFFPDGAVGKRFFGPGGVVWLTVAGVVEDVKEDGLDAAPFPAAYIPHRDWAWRTMNVVARVRSADPREVLPAVEEAVWSVASTTPLSRVRTMDEVVRRSVEDVRLTARLFTLFGVLALLLGTVGVYGVTAYALGRRRHEFGIRAALGAPRSRLVRGALGRSFATLGLGLAVGAAAAPFVGRALGASIESVRTGDPGVLAAAAGALGVVVLVATWLPARRATRVDPVESLRAE